MNRENKRIRLEKGYYRSHACLKPFICKVCGREVVPEGAGSAPPPPPPTPLPIPPRAPPGGPGRPDCGGIMDPVGVWVRKNGEWAVIHRCRRCGSFSSNRLAADDNPLMLMSIALRPLSSPPFPLMKLREMAEALGSAGEFKFQPETEKD